MSIAETDGVAPDLLNDEPPRDLTLTDALTVQELSGLARVAPPVSVMRVDLTRAACRLLAAYRS